MPILPGVVQLFYANYFAKKMFKIDNTSFRLPFTNSSLAKGSPSFIFLNNTSISSLVNTFIFAVILFSASVYNSFINFFFFKKMRVI